MTAHIFISPRTDLKERWTQAFPNALGVERVAQITRESKAIQGVLWLDLAAIDSIDRLATLEECVEVGWPVVVLAATPSESEAFQLLNAGARGYCHVGSHPKQLNQVGVAVEHGGLWMPPNLLQRLLALSLRVVPSGSVDESVHSKLTPSELQVAQEGANGKSNQEVAMALGITEQSVKVHLSAIFKKLGVKDRVQLALTVTSARSALTEVQKPSLIARISRFWRSIGSR